MPKRSERSIRASNRGVERNKKPLSNIEYLVEVHQKIKNPSVEYDEYKFTHSGEFKGYLVLLWRHQKGSQESWNWHGFISPKNLREKLGGKQWGKFCQGKRYFILQRRENGKNKRKVNR